MHIKKTIGTAVAAVLISGVSAGASAETIIGKAITGTSFNDFVIGAISVESLSDISGSLFAADNITFGSLSMSLDSVTFSSATVGNLKDLDSSATRFTFKDVTPGLYQVKASGIIGPSPSDLKSSGQATGSGQIGGLAILGASFNMAPVPEPESYAMLLAGLGLMGTIARRRVTSKKV